MITIGYSTRKTNPSYQEYIRKTCLYKGIEVIEKVNNGEKSLSQVYNEILNESSNNIVVLIHDDLEFDTNKWGEKVLKIFEKNPEYGIVGLAGTTFLPKSGQWWEDRTKMWGIVNHKHEGKKWESKYSPSLELKLKDVVLVDGLFLAINKQNIKESFDETVEGFHMYDVAFCYKNFIQGVKVGVTTQVRVTHLSIGMTNNQWENNRQIFADKYSNNLPLKVKYDDNSKLNVLIGCLFFQKYTGSEMYVFELAKNLIKLNCSVSILSYETSGPLVAIAKKLGINVYNVKSPPGYKVGDGKWMINTQNGPQPSQPNQFYKTDEVHFDIIHCQHKPMVELMVNLYPTIDKISTIHSEVIDLENPVIHPSIKKYIAIRPEIEEYIIQNFEIPKSSVEVVYNPLDTSKFNVKNFETQNYILFVGSIDYLRKNTIFDLVDVAKNDGKELWLVGENKSDYLPVLLSNSHVKHFGPTLDVEKYIHKCTETAGILLGRTTIEGWLCGKSGWIYDIDKKGEIKSKKLFSPPKDLEKFDSIKVTQKIKNNILEILNS
jgi:hypothetical protein